MPKKAWLFPEGAERKYARLFAAHLRSLNAEIVKRLKERSMLRIDAEEDTFSEELTAIFAALAAWLLIANRTFTNNIIVVFGDVNAFNDKQFRGFVAATVGIVLPPSQTLPRSAPVAVTDPNVARARFGAEADTARFEAWLDLSRRTWIADNNLYVSSVTNSVLSNAEAIVRTNVKRGVSPTKIAELLAESLLVSQRRARLFVRDQIGNLEAELTQKRSKSLGSKSYRWRDMRDERVRGNPGGKYPGARPSHWHRNDKVFEWDNPPEGGHPGEARLCRCKADPII